MNINVLGSDLAINVLQLHGIDTVGKTVLLKKLTRVKLAASIMQLLACSIGMEACSSVNHWARKFQ